MRSSLLVLTVQLVAQGVVALWPQPTSLTNGTTTMSLSPHFDIRIPDGSPEDLGMAVERIMSALRSTEHEYLSVDRGTELLMGKEDLDAVHTLNVDYKHSEPWSSILEEATKKLEDRDESYELNVPLNGTATLRANTSLGLLRGLTTFQQLFYSLPSAYKRPRADQPAQTVLDDMSDYQGHLILPFAPFQVSDRPMFSWRSVMLDTSRNWFHPSEIEKLLDTMSFVKLNVFHWHITDSQSWPAVFKSHPELANAAYKPEQIYTEQTIAHLIQYAGQRGIDVVMELDMPGHTASIGKTYPDYIAGFHHDPWSAYAVEPPAGQIRFTMPEVTELVQDVLNDALRLVSSSYFSTGGDEINAACYGDDEITQAALHKSGQSLNEALAKFTSFTQGVLAQHQNSAVLWQEMVLDHPENNLSKDTIAQVWVSSADAKAVAERGYRIIHAASDYFYLDCGRGNWIDMPHGGNSWCDPYKSWARMYSFDPYANMTDEEKQLVVGGQASLWTEQTDSMNMETVMWPRAAALAELFWTGSAHGSFPLNATAQVHRFNDIRYRLVDRGVRASQLQPHWCAIRPGQCGFYDAE